MGIMILYYSAKHQKELFMLCMVYLIISTVASKLPMKLMDTIYN